MFGFSWTEIIWFLVTCVAGVVMWATQVGPDEAASNLSQWAVKFGVKNPPLWLKERATDRRVRLGAGVLLAALLFWGGMLFSSWLSPREAGPGSVALPVSNPPIIRPVEQKPAVPVVPATKAKTYTASDVRNLLDALTEAQKIVDEVVSPPYFRVENLIINHHLLNGTQQFAAQLAELRDQIKNEVWPKIDDFVYKKNAAYKEEMEFAFALEKEAVKGAMLRKLDIAIDAIKKLPANPTPDLAELVKPQMKAVEDEIQPKVYDWLGTSRRRIASMQSTLEKDGTINHDAK